MSEESDLKPRRNNFMDMDITENFNLFIEEGNIFDFKKGARPLEKFIPSDPDSGLNNALQTDDFLDNSMRTGSKLTKRFFGF